MYTALFGAKREGLVEPPSRPRDAVIRCFDFTDRLPPLSPSFGPTHKMAHIQRYKDQMHQATGSTQPTLRSPDLSSAQAELVMETDEICNEIRAKAFEARPKATRVAYSRSQAEWKAWCALKDYADK